MIDKELEKIVPNTCISQNSVTSYMHMVYLIYFHAKEMIACSMDRKSKQDNPVLNYNMDILELLDDKYASLLDAIQGSAMGHNGLDGGHA